MLRFAARPREFGVTQLHEWRVEIAHRLLAHAAMADGGAAQRTLNVEAHRAALAATGIIWTTSKAHIVSGKWQTASILFPSGSKTKAP